MNKLVLIFFLFLLASCNNETATNATATTNNTEPIIQSKEVEAEKSNDSTNKKIIKEIENSAPTTFLIKDSTNYSPNFLKEFRKYFGCFDSATLSGDSIIVNGERKTYIKIPTDLPLDSVVLYKAKKNGKNYSLTIKRINYSTIEYVFNGQKGVADLQPNFYLGAEGVFEAKNGKTYGMVKYNDLSEKRCKYILIGIGNIEASTLTYCDVDGKISTTIDFVK